MTKVMLYTLLLIIILFPLGQLTKLPVPVSPSINIYAHDILIAILSLLASIYVLNHRKNIHLPPLSKPIGVFIIAALISIILNVARYPLHELITGSLYIVRWTAYTSLYFSTYIVIHHNGASEKRILQGLTYAGIIAALFGLIQYFLYPNLRNLMYLGWDPHEYRIFGTYFDSGFTGLLFVFTLILLYTFIRHDKKMRLWVAGFFVVVYGALALTYSRSSYLAFIAAASIYSVLDKSIKPFVISLIMIVPLFFILPQPAPTAEGTDLTRTTSAEARLTNYEQSIEIIRSHPVTGIGFNMLRYENRNRGYIPDYEWEINHAGSGLDSSVLFIWATMGILGLGAVGYLLWYMVTIRQPVVTATLTAVCIHSLFNNSLFYPWVMIWVWILLGVAHATRRS